MKVEEVNTIELGLANQKQILCYNVLGFEQGVIKEGFTKLKDIYEFIKECKRIDKEEDIKDIYLVEIETEDQIFGNYTISKRNNKYYLKPSKIC